MASVSTNPLPPSAPAGEALPSATAALSRTNPFPGLRPYVEEDANWFFGRGAEINDLLKRLRRLHFVAIVGASGCGKSSLIRAGVLPQIRDGYLDSTWSIAAFRPGERPVVNLAEALGPAIGREASTMTDTLHSGSLGLVKIVQQADRGPNSGHTRNEDRKLLILVDQFEELFQFAHRGGDAAQEEVKAFLKLLLTGAASDDVAIYVVITMRLEWLNECATYVGMAEAINEGIYLVPQMSRRQFNQAILGPLDAAGGLMTSALLDRMLNDLDCRSDQLPVLQHALLRLWELRRGAEPFDIREYETVGTFSNCLSAHAEEVFAELSAPQKRIAELLFRSITQVFKGRKIRRPRTMDEIVAATGAEFSQVEAVVAAFSRTGRSFLVTTQGKLELESIVDISHEALIRQWDRLSEWVDDEADTQSRIDRLHTDAAEWARDHKAFKSSIYRGRQLSRAQQFLPKLDPASASYAFVKAGQRARLFAIAQVVALSVFIVMLIGSVIVRELYDAGAREKLAIRQKDVAQKEADLANEQALKSKQFQDSVVQQINAAKGSATALAAIAENIQAHRVYLQYVRGTPLDQSKSVQSLLQKQGYSVPALIAVSPERSPDRPQVRFFHIEDQAEADRIAGLLGPLLKTGVSTQTTANPNNVVPAGQFEVWLAAAAPAVQQAAQAPTQTSPPPAEIAVKKPEAESMPAPVLTPPTISDFSASATRVEQGQSVMLTWQTSAATGIGLKGIGAVQPAGSMQVNPQQTTTYELNASGPGGSTLKQLRVEVVPIPVAETKPAGNSEPMAVKAAINRYKDAYESESLDDVKKAWPAIPKAQQKTFKMVFDQFNAIRLTLSCRDEDIHVDGAIATATCRQTAVYTAKGKKQPEMSTTTTFKLTKQDGVWVIDSLE